MPEMLDAAKQIGGYAFAHPRDTSALLNWFAAIELAKNEDKVAAYSQNELFRYYASNALKSDIVSPGEAAKIYDALKKSYLLSAKDNFSDFMFYIEWNRAPEKRFYQPRMGYLKPMVDGYQKLHDGGLNLLTISQPKRSGKALTLDTKLLTPYGYIRMGDVKVGDVLIGADGKPTTVTQIYPQGKVPVYDVVFSDGEIVTTCANHNWLAQTQEDRWRRTSRVLTTGDMMRGRLHLGGDEHNNYSVKYVQPAEFSDKKELPIAPYLMGVLIGDGSFFGGLRITNPEKFILDKCQKLLPDDECFIDYSYEKKCPSFAIRAKVVSHSRYRKCPTTLQAIRDLGLAEKNCYAKHIPEQYLWASVEDRWELLRGLMDTDGTASTSGHDASYNTASKVLAEQFVFLVKSLGGAAVIHERMGKYRKNGEIHQTRVNYRIGVVFPEGSQPFSLPRKAARYRPVRKQLYHFIEDIRPAGYEEAQCICVDSPDHLFVVGDDFIPTHNTQVEINFTLWMSGAHPDRSSLLEGAGDALVNSFYKGCLEYLTDPQYLFYDVFPEARMVQTNADMKTINLASKSRFPTIMCRSIDATQVGLSEATNVLVLDDCVLGREEAMNRALLDKKWECIRGDVLGRRIQGTPIVATGTRYSLYDPIGHLQEEAQKLGWRWKAVEIPALDPVTDESNYDHIRDGKHVFTTEYFRGERELLSDEQWESEFQQQPFEAKGLLFPEDKLQRYFKLPSDREPDTIIAVGDTKEKGADYVMLPVGYVYGADVFIEDVVFDDAGPEHTKPECANALRRNNVARATFESNAAGAYFARDVEALLTKLGGKTSIRTKRTVSNKAVRIETSSDNILKHFWFKDKSTYDQRSQYAAMIKALTTYTRSGKNAHDDAPDGLAMLEIETRWLHSGECKAIDRPW